jgi:hypothetical protein
MTGAIFTHGTGVPKVEFDLPAGGFIVLGLGGQNHRARGCPACSSRTRRSPLVTTSSGWQSDGMAWG